MKTKTYLLILALLTIVCIGFAQNKTGSLKVTLMDAKSKESIPFANITLYAGKTQKYLAIPDVPVIKSITDGPTHGSIKINLAKTTSPLLGKKVKRTLIVNLTTDGADDTTFKIVLLTGSSKKLIIPNLTRGIEVFVKISAMNAKGTSKYSNTVSFIPNTGASPVPTTTPTTTPTTGTTPPATA